MSRRSTKQRRSARRRAAPGRARAAAAREHAAAVCDAVAYRRALPTSPTTLAPFDIVSELALLQLRVSHDAMRQNGWHRATNFDAWLRPA